MNTQNKSTKTKAIWGVMSTLAIAALLFTGLTGAAYANSGNEKSVGKEIAGKLEGRINEMVRKQDPATEVSMGGNGKVAVSNAKVLSVSGSTITARVSFGAYNMDWTVITDSNTKFAREKGNANALSDIKIGDTINFVGPINTTATSPTITATLVRDVSLKSQVQHLFEGTIVSLSASTTPATALIKIGGTNYTVNIPSGISVLNKNWQVVSIGSYQVGNTVRLYGSAEASSTSVINATVIRNTSI